MVALRRGSGFADGLKDIHSKLSLEETRTRKFISKSDDMLMVCSNEFRVKYCTRLLLDK